MKCVLCRFEVPEDDVEFRGAKPETCICVRCYAARAKAEHPMPKALRQEVERIVNA